MEGQGDVVVEQSKHDLQSLLFCPDRDFLICNNGDEVKVDNLTGKKVGLYFSASWCGPCQQFTPNLVEVYNELSPKDDFEIVFVSADKDDEPFKGYFSKMPWLAIPFSDSNTRDRLDKSFKVPISDLVGKNILLYFSAHWCPPCRAFTPKLVETYHQIKAKDNAFELIFISSDRDQTSFEEYFSQMPWLALPFEDDRKDYLDRIFKVQGIPMLVAIGPTGRTVTTEARKVVMSHGAGAYPFTEARLKEIEAKNEEMAKGWPKKVKHERHEHELELIRRPEYVCDGCEEGGTVWSFYCEECDFDLHPKCALEENKGTKGVREDDMEVGMKTKEGYVCDGDVCRKA